MYIPRYYQVNDVSAIWDFVQKNAFGTIVTTDQGKPVATHLPFQLINEGDRYYLTGHFAYANSQWRTLETTENVLVIFQGPHAYISASWYEHENVSTWNYQSVHIYGKASILSEEELKQDLARLLEKYEKHRENPVLWEKLSQDVLRQAKGVVGFKIEVKEIHAADKLSQNRDEKDYRHIVDKLYEEGDMDSVRMAQVMEKRLNDKAQF
jgi:transcriptional regulator